MNDIKKLHDKIIKMCKKYMDGKSYWRSDKEKYIQDIYNISKNQSKIIEYNERYSIDIPYDSNLSSNYCRVKDCCYLSYFKDGYTDKEKGCGKFISWSDDGKQPKDERLYEISFPTGAYILGNSYQEGVFNLMFSEIKGYGPKYSDTVNSHLYFELENCSRINTDLKGIIKRYKEKAIEKEKEDEADRLRKRLKEIEDENKKGEAS